MSQEHIPYAYLGPVAQVTKQITPNIYAEDQFSVIPRYRGSSHGFVTTSEGIVMIDCPMMPTDAIRWRFEMAKLNKGDVRYIINTDSHHDHTTGNGMFPGTIISTVGVRETFPHVPEPYTFGQISEIDPGDLSRLAFYKPRPPTITFTEKLTLYCGDHTFECYHLPGHTPQHAGVWVPEEKVFFAGDNCTYRTQPVLASCLPLEWVESLKKIESFHPEWIVGGHGEVGPGEAATQFREFIQTCIDMTRDAIEKGMTKEEAMDKLSFENLTGPAVHPGAETQRRNVARIYEMLSK